MFLRDMKIGTQLRLGPGIILVFVAAVGFLSWWGTSLIWGQMDTMYNHPLTVRRAIGAFEADVLVMHRGMKDLMLAKTESDMAVTLHDIETRRADAEKQIEVLFDRYLGPRSDLSRLRDEFRKWNAVREETIQVLRAGNREEAFARTTRAGVGGAQAEAVMAALREVDNFAIGKGDALFKTATELHAAVNRGTVLVIALILILSMLISWRIIKGIREPLGLLTAAADRFRNGDTGVRVGWDSKNELGSLAAAFNAMAGEAETRLRVGEMSARLAAVMLRETEMRPFCRGLLAALMEHTGSQIGAVYLLNSGENRYEHYESIGLSAAGRAHFSADGFEGELGAALAARKIVRITGAGDNERFILKGVAADIAPREIITIPVLSEHDVVAVLSLASVTAYAREAILLANGAWDLLNTRMSGVMAFEQIRELARNLEKQNTELDAQQRELTAQADELTRQNTELDMQKRQVEEANRLKSTFLSNMSHELRTPLNSVIALSGVLQNRLAGKIPEDEHGYLEIIARNGKHLLDLINDILDLSRIEAGREETVLEQFSLHALVEELLALLEPQTWGKNIALRNLVPGDFPQIVSDREKFRHILQNLAGNAVKFTEAGSVEIAAFREGESIRVTVSDTGIGIPEDQLPHIFQEFRQADAGASRKYGGTGLGLSIADKYAALLHGGISAESAPGKGSVFTLTLPVGFLPPGSAEGGGAAAQPAAPARRTGSVLVVDDNETAVIQMTDFLSGHGYAVRVARGGAEALAEIESSPPDAVILDLMMPEMDGFRVLGQIRENPKSASLPVLILTAKYVNKEELAFLKGNNIHQLIQKGAVDRAGLLRAVDGMFPPQAAPSAPPVENGPDEGGAPLPKVLVVEDNPDNMSTMRALLGGRFDMICAVDGHEGVAQARRHRPDIILMDLALPVMDGFEALAAIRADGALRAVPVLAVTASAMKGDRETVLARGFDAYLSKPVDRDELFRVIYRFLKGDESNEDTGNR